MNCKKILIVSIFLLAILTIGAVGASEDADAIAAEDAETIAQDSDAIVIQNSTIDDEVNDFVEEFDGNFTVDMSYYDTTDGDNAFATLDVQEPTNGRVLIYSEANELICEKDLDVNDFYENGDVYSNDILVGDVNFDMLDQGKQFLNFVFTDDNDEHLIDQMYQIDYAKNRNEFTMMYVEYMEIYNGFITEDMDDPIIALFAESTKNYGLWISKPGSYDFFFYKNLKKMIKYDHGIYTKNNLNNYNFANDWTYYGITAADLIEESAYSYGFDTLVDGDTLVIKLTKVDYDDNPQGQPLAYFERNISFVDDGFYLTQDEPEPEPVDDFNPIFLDANVADNDVVLIIPEDQMPEGVDEILTIRAYLWGPSTETTWNISRIVPSERGYEWTTGDLNIDDLMWDIYPETGLKIEVICYRDGQQADCVSDYVTIYNSPYVNCADLDFSDDSEPAVAFAYFPENAENEFVISIYKDGSFFANRTFKIDEMYEYEDEEGDYFLYLKDLGITEFGEYTATVIFTDEDTQETFSYCGTFNVVPFVIYFYHDWDDMTEPFCRIALPEDSEGTVTIRVNGTKVYKKYLGEVPYHEYYRGPGFYVDVNSLNIKQSGHYEVEVTVNANGIERTAETEGDVEVSENTIEFFDSIYGDFNIEMHIGTAISPDSVIILYLNGAIGAVGNYDETLYLNFEKNYTDIYDILLPGQYYAVLKVDGETIGENYFEVSDTSGNVFADVTCENNIVYVNFMAGIPLKMMGYGLDIYVDAEDPYYWFGTDDPLISIRDEQELLALLDEQMHAIELGELDPGEHIVYVVYRSEVYTDPYGYDSGDYFVRIFNITVGGSDEPIATTMTASNVTSTYLGEGMIEVTLTDINGTPISGATLVADYGGDKEYAITDAEGWASFSVTWLMPGNYTVAISYAGDMTYAASSATSQVQVERLETYLFAEDVINQDLVATLMDYYEMYVSGAIISADFGEFKLTAITNEGMVAFSTAALKPGYYNVTLKFEGDEIHMASNTSAIVFIDKIATDITASNVTTTYQSDDVIEVTLTDASGNPIDGATIKADYGEFDDVATTDLDGKASFTTSDLNPGNYTVVISFEGDEIYLASSAVSNVAVNKLSTIITALNVNTTYNSGEELIATLIDVYNNPLAGEQISIALNNIGYTLITDANGQAKVSTNGLNCGTYVATIAYGGNAIYDSASTTADVVINKVDLTIDAPDVSVAYNGNGELVATLTNAITGKAVVNAKVVFTLNGVTTTVKTDANGQAKVSTDGLNIGTYAATVSYNGNAKYNAVSTTANVVVNKADLTIDAPDVIVDYGDDGELVATLTNVGKAIVNAKLIFNLNGVTTSVKTDANGKAKLSIKELNLGTYTATITYNGNAKYNPATTTAKVVVGKIDVVIDAPDVSVASGDTVELVATVINTVSGKGLINANIKVNINGVDYSVKTNSSGHIKVSISGLATGNYVATISYKGNAKYNPASTTVNVVVGKINVAIDAPDVNVAYNGNGELVATLINTNTGKAVVNAKVVITLNGVTTTVKTDANGQAKVSTDGLNLGTYTATIKYNGNAKYNAVSTTANVVVNKADLTIDAPDVSVAYNGNGELVATLTNAGKAILNAKLIFNLNGVTTTVKTDANGQAKVSTDGLNLGTYTATVTYNGNAKYNPASATANVVVNKADIGISAVYDDKADELVATLTNAGGGQSIVNANVNFKIDGVSYNVKTDANGQAKLSTASLTPGDHTAIISYKGNAKYNPSSTTYDFKV